MMKKVSFLPAILFIAMCIFLESMQAHANPATAVGTTTFSMNKENKNKRPSDYFGIIVTRDSADEGLEKCLASHRFKPSKCQQAYTKAIEDIPLHRLVAGLWSSVFFFWILVFSYEAYIRPAINFFQRD